MEDIYLGALPDSGGLSRNELPATVNILAAVALEAGGGVFAEAKNRTAASSTAYIVRDSGHSILLSDRSVNIEKTMNIPDPCLERIF
jgi:hypothetical protein